MRTKAFLCSILGFEIVGTIAHHHHQHEDRFVKDVHGVPGATITYKETSICEQKAKAFAGHVHLPSDVLLDTQDPDPYNVSMFFWYFEARRDPKNAPTALYLAGGPGESSMFGAVSDGGPCYIGSDSNSTSLNEWSWNGQVNMLYVDQPITAGFSYDSLINATFDLLSDTITPFEEYNGTVPKANSTLLHAVLPSQLHTANSTILAARTMWHFLQAFVEFPEWKHCSEKPRISLWGNSYGGFWVPNTAAHVLSQNSAITEGELNGTVIEIDTAGITNGCIDMLYQAEWYPQMAYNNTYNLEVIDEDTYEGALHNFTKPGGCRDQIIQCRELSDAYDPEQTNVNATVGEACVEALYYCAQYVLGPYDASNRSDFDMAHFTPDSFPPYYAAGFFNQEWVQKELAVPLNFTPDSVLSENILIGDGDIIRTPGMKALEYLLGSGVKVALVYGDRDYRCPWLGAEQLSLDADWTGADAYRTEAGYESIRTNTSYNGGVVRQHSNLTFARVFQSGHDVSAYQPETSFRIFNRVMSNKDVATGRLSTDGAANNYTSHGPDSSYGFKEILPVAPAEVLCYIYSVSSSCTVDQYLAMANGTAEIVDFVVTKPGGGGGPISGGTHF